MTNLPVTHRTTLGVASIAAAMLMAGPAFAADAADAAADADEAGKSTIVVTGQRVETSLPTVRGPIIDVPQVVSVVSAETIKEQKIISLEQALRNVAGVTTQVGEGGVVNGDQFFIRGQAAGNDVFTDGLRDFGQFTRDAFNYEQIEVLKGSSSTALGRGVAGGAINTTSKMPRAEEAFAFDLGAGTADYRRVTVDANKPLSDSIALRLNFMAHRNDGVDRDVVNSHRWAIAPAVTFGLGTNMQFTAIYLHQEEDRIPDYGVPIAVTTTPTGGVDDIEHPVTELGVKRSVFYGFSGSDADDVNVDSLTLKFAYDAGDGVKITSDTKLGSYQRFFRQSVPSCPGAVAPVTPASIAASCSGRLLDGNPLTVPTISITPRGGIDTNTRGIQNVSTLLYSKPLGGMRNELLIGWDVSYQTSDRVTFNNGTAITKDLFNPVNTGSPTLPGTVSSRRDLRGTDLSVFIDDRFWLAETLSVNLGLRYQNFKSEQEQLTAATTTCNGLTQVSGQCFEIRVSKNNIFSPKASLIWEPSENVSAYLTYSKASVPQANAIGNGDSLAGITLGGTISRADLPPEETETFDAGVKLALFGNRLLVQSSIYQITRNNATETDPATGFRQYSSEPKQRLRGFELGLSGGVSPDLRLSANYAYIDAKIIDAFTGTTGTNAVVVNTAVIGNQVRYVPKHAASLWANYKPVGGALKGLELGGGLVYQSKVFLNADNTQITPSYVSVDALLGYTIGKFRLAVNGYNLTNKLYYSQVNGGRVVPAAGRSFVASLGVSF
jgi:catecholate siderophore receptor